jgi:hypothetical protein
MHTWKWTLALAAVALTVLALFLPWASCSSALDHITTPTTTQDVGTTDTPEAEAEQEATAETAPDTTDQSEEPEEPEQQATMAERFVEAGGQKLCLAMVYALNPDWRMDACKAASNQDRQTACENQRRPLTKFADDVCRTVIEESLRLDLDPAMVLAVIERESSFGRAVWDRKDRAYEVQTDICKLTLAKSRIVDRRPGRREGTELLTWTYGSQTPNAGSVARNRQPVIVVAEDDDRLVVNTCVAGERGIMQVTPREIRIGGNAIGLTGSTAQRTAALEADPVLQVRIGCQALHDHRALMPPEQQADWTDWIHAYNTGSPERGDHGLAYTLKVVQHYLDACQGWIPADDGDLLAVQTVESVWPECARLRKLREVLSRI